MTLLDARVRSTLPCRLRTFSRAWGAVRSRSSSSSSRVGQANWSIAMASERTPSCSNSSAAGTAWKSAAEKVLAAAGPWRRNHQRRGASALAKGSSGSARSAGRPAKRPAPPRAGGGGADQGAPRAPAREYLKPLTDAVALAKRRWRGPAGARQRWRVPVECGYRSQAVTNHAGRTKPGGGSTCAQCRVSAVTAAAMRASSPYRILPATSLGEW